MISQSHQSVSRAQILVVVCVMLIASCGVSPQDGLPGESTTQQEIQAQIVAAGLEDAFAAEWLETLCDSIGPRLTGSAEMDSAIEFAVATMREEGFDKVEEVWLGIE